MRKHKQQADYQPSQAGMQSWTLSKWVTVHLACGCNGWMVMVVSWGWGSGMSDMQDHDVHPSVCAGGNAAWPTFVVVIYLFFVHLIFDVCGLQLFLGTYTVRFPEERLNFDTIPASLLTGRHVVPWEVVRPWASQELLSCCCRCRVGFGENVGLHGVNRRLQALSADSLLVVIAKDEFGAPIGTIARFCCLGYHMK